MLNLTSESRPEPVIVAVQKSVQDTREEGDIVFEGIGWGVCTYWPTQQKQMYIIINKID